MSTPAKLRQRAAELRRNAAFAERGADTEADYAQAAALEKQAKEMEEAQAAQSSPYITSAERRQLEELLGKRWVRAADIAAANDKFDDRTLRALAEQEPTLFITSNLGYKLTREAGLEEIRACAARLKSQANKMGARADKLFDLVSAREARGEKI